MAKTSGPAAGNGTDPATNLPDRRADDRTYDAIVIGGGHNGLVNGAYLAKNGLRTLILERRHLVGGAAITEELRPGFWFTTFSYALSLLRPDIIHELELAKHGFMPLLMPSTFALRESDWDTEKERFGDTVQATLESFFPGFGDLVLQREIRTPLDIERTVGLSEGNIFAGEFLAPQMFLFRPAPGWSQYRTPIDGYYQCGSGTHPGGCVMGAPGKLAAGQILKDRARTGQKVRDPVAVDAAAGA